MANDIYNEVCLESADHESISALSTHLQSILPELTARKLSSETDFTKNCEVHRAMFAFWTRRSPFLFVGLDALFKRFSDVEVDTAYMDIYEYSCLGLVWLIESEKSKFMPLGAEVGSSEQTA
jgi:hypothetical protein